MSSAPPPPCVSRPRLHARHAQHAQHAKRAGRCPPYAPRGKRRIAGTDGGCATCHAGHAGLAHSGLPTVPAVPTPTSARKEDTPDSTAMRGRGWDEVFFLFFPPRPRSPWRRDTARRHSERSRIVTPPECRLCVTAMSRRRCRVAMTTATPRVTPRTRSPAQAVQASCNHGLPHGPAHGLAAPQSGSDTLACRGAMTLSPLSWIRTETPKPTRFLIDLRGSVRTRENCCWDDDLPVFKRSLRLTALPACRAPGG